MMEELKIGIVAEGISDYWVLKHIVERMLRDKDQKGNCKSLYDEILSKKKKVKEIEVISKYNYGFDKFVESLKRISVEE